MRFVWYAVLAAILGSTHSQSCQTAQRGVRGVCIKIYDCPVLLQAFEQTPIPQALVNFLRQSQCGFDGYTPKVCCSNSLNLNKVNEIPLPTQTFLRRREKRAIQKSGHTQSASKEVSESDRRTSVGSRQRPRPRPTYTESNNDLLPTGNCGVQGEGDRIYNGQITDIDEFPWMALLGYRTNKGALAYECGGVLISKRYVLTASHCVVGEVNAKVGRLEVVRLGEYNLGTNPDCVSSGQYLDCNDPKIEVPVEQAIAHPGFSDQNVNRKDDIALVRLSRNVQFTDFVKPICIPDGQVYLQTGERVVVAGWGKTLTARHSEVKLKLEMPIFDSRQCYNKYAAYRAILTDRQMCAGGEYAKDACFGDSGGPLMRLGARNVWTAIGIVSFGNGCGKSGWPGVYTNVGKYASWIRQNIRP